MKSGYLSEVFASFQGEGAHVGRRHLFVRMAGCNIRCRYCDTPDSLERTAGFTIHARKAAPVAQPNPVSASDLANAVSALLESEAPIDAIALTGGEPLTQSDFLAMFLHAGQFAVPVLLETNGVLPRRLPDVLPYVDIISMDIKLPSNTGEGGFWDEHAAFLELAREKDLYAKILVDQTTSADDIDQAGCLLASIRPEIPSFLQPISDAAGKPLIDSDKLTELYITLRRHLTAIRVVPQTHKLLGIR